MPQQGYTRFTDEDAEDEAILRQFDSLGIEQRPDPQQAPLLRRRRRIVCVMAGAGAIAVLALIVTLSVQAAVGGSSSSRPAWVCPQEAMQGRTPGSITFYAIGDWGRQGVSPQKTVAKMMATVAECMPPSFIISTGDNFYSHGLTSPTDWQVDKSFTSVYSYSQLQVPWYAVLGNHDYGDGIDPGQNKDCAANSLSKCPQGCCYSAVWQHTGKLQNDARWHLQNGTYAVPTGAAGLLDIFMVDTNPFIPRYAKTPWYNNAGGIWEQQPEVTKSQLRGYLQRSRAQWKVVVGHHPIASFGSHCAFSMKNDCEDMAWLQPELQSANVAAYMAGHDHDLQHNIQLSKPDDDNSSPLWPHYIVSGAGSETRANEKSRYKAKKGYSLEFMTDASGFVAVQVNATHMAMYFYGDRHSEPMHTVVLQARGGNKAAAAAADAPKGPAAPRSGLAVVPGQQQVIHSVQTATAAEAAAAAAAATGPPGVTTVGVVPPTAATALQQQPQPAMLPSKPAAAQLQQQQQQGPLPSKPAAAQQPQQPAVLPNKPVAAAPLQQPWPQLVQPVGTAVPQATRSATRVGLGPPPAPVLPAYTG